MVKHLSGELPTIAGRIPAKLYPRYLEVSEEYSDSEIVREGVRTLYRKMTKQSMEATA